MWHRVFRLTPRDWIGLAEAASLLIWAQTMLRWRSPADVIARATTLRTQPAGSVSRTISRSVWLVGAASRHLVRVPCLPRSIALARMLARRGIASDIRIGVRTRDDRLKAHAWLEVDGRAVNDIESVVKGYAAFDRPLSQVGELRRHFR